MTVRNIAVFGYSQAKPDSSVFKDAKKVCKTLAEAGFIIVNGGGPGVMRAASVGAREGGGKVIGVTFYPTESEIYEGKDPKNPIDTEIETKNYVERTLKLLELGDVYLVFRGGAGTLSEFGMAWELGHLYFGHHKPVILYGKFWHEVIEVLKKNMLLAPQELRVIEIATEPEEILTKLVTIEKKSAELSHIHKEKAFQL